ncbi:hypothetical protein CALVIDRAFT_131301 [Calocera viscosa TUFC12733]|uniref:Rhodanese domain-containing protein n=1 Tax=Calocera viscosa (strain TUFC12733) TaxID=1330018 RepID=A0A167RUY9_CALVF|nr:hypothetical protein CALVIDRAFT_131301 [Calocera viscosa TUFC12733]
MSALGRYRPLSFPKLARPPFASSLSFRALYSADPLGMSFSLPYSFISGKELKKLLTSTTDQPPKIVDVRDDDHISLHYPSTRFITEVNKLVEKLKDEQVVVFHCALSQQRGPKAARIYAETRANLLPDAPAQKVVVLRGGFMQFQAEFRVCPIHCAHIHRPDARAERAGPARELQTRVLGYVKPLTSPTQPYTLIKMYHHQPCPRRHFHRRPLPSRGLPPLAASPSARAAPETAP